MRNTARNLVAAVGLTLTLAAAGIPVSAQETPTGGTKPPVRLWVDEETGQVFTRPGPGRTPLDLGGVDSGTLQKQIEQQVQQKVNEKAREVEQKVQAAPPASDVLRQTQEQVEALTKQVMEMEPAWRSYTETWKDKIHIGALLFADWALYSTTGFGPQVLTQVNPPGPGNDMYNSFDITRTYLNFFFTPTSDWTVRLTPNMYRATGTAQNQQFGRVSAIGSDLTGDLSVRLKYAYLQYKALFDDVDPLRGDTVTLGEVGNPIVAWEEDLYGFRFVNLIPWNYLSLSSTQVGLSFQGPVKFGGKQYIDYDLGVYNNASFHAMEQTDTKQGMARISYYPFGAAWRFDGLGITGFYDYGYGNSTSDTIPTAFKTNNDRIIRLAALVHYTTERWGIAVEFDWGRNAFRGTDLFSGSGPADYFCTPSSCSGFVPTKFAAFSNLVKALLDTGTAEEEGYAVFGHYHIPRTPFTLFGLYEHFLPNTNIDKNPLDFDRMVAGISYQFNEYVRIALDTQSLFYYHNQLIFHPSPLMVSRLGVKSPVPDAVPGDTHAVFLNVEFSY